MSSSGFDGVMVESDTISVDKFESGDVVESYSVNRYATVDIIESDRRNELLYRVTEPDLNDFEEYIREEVSNRLVDVLKYEDVSDIDSELLPDVVWRKAYTIISDYVMPTATPASKVRQLLGRTTEPVLSKTSTENILYYIVRDYAYYGKLTPLMDDPRIEDISCNAPHTPIFIYHSEYRDLMTNIVYEEAELDQFIRSLSQYAGKHISISDPLLDGSLPNGSRLQATLSDEVTGDGSNFTIRKFSDVPFTPVDLINFGTFSLDQMAYLWLAIENNKSLIFAGGTASGKTTSMNAISLFIPPGGKTITIEDTREISLRHNNWIKSVTRDSFGNDDVGEVGMYKLLEAALRQRPEYIIVGEIRGEEAKTLFQAMSTGHTTYSTMHADSVESAVHRLENEPINVPRQMLASLDILCVQTQSFVGNKRVRRNQVVTEIGQIEAESGRLRTNNIYEWMPSSDSFKQSGNSDLLREIQKQRAWSNVELQWQLDARKELLAYMIEEDITEYEVVTDLIRSFILDVDGVYELLANDKLKEATNDFTETGKLKSLAEDTDSDTVQSLVTDSVTESDEHNTIFSSIRRAIGQSKSDEDTPIPTKDPLQNPLIPEEDRAILSTDYEEETDTEDTIEPTTDESNDEERTQSIDTEETVTDTPESETSAEESTDQDIIDTNKIRDLLEEGLPENTQSSIDIEQLKQDVRDTTDTEGDSPETAPDPTYDTDDNSSADEPEPEESPIVESSEIDSDDHDTDDIQTTDEDELDDSASSSNVVTSDESTE